MVQLRSNHRKVKYTATVRETLLDLGKRDAAESFLHIIDPVDRSFVLDIVITSHCR